MLFFIKIYKVDSTGIYESGYSLYNFDNPITINLWFFDKYYPAIIAVTFFRIQKSLIVYHWNYYKRCS